MSRNRFLILKRRLYHDNFPNRRMCLVRTQDLFRVWLIGCRVCSSLATVGEVLYGEDGSNSSIILNQSCEPPRLEGQSES